MNEAPHIAELEATRTAFIHLTVAREQMPEVFGPAVQELVSTLAEQDVAITGPLFAHHLAMSPQTFDFELGFPVAQPLVPAGRVEAGERPAVKVARTIYQGPFGGLPDAWGQFHDWVENSGLGWAPDIWECYLVGPESESDPANWRTELNRPLTDSHRG
jgi:effector-binding domain-containing protein